VYMVLTPLERSFSNGNFVVFFARWLKFTRF